MSYSRLGLLTPLKRATDVAIQQQQHHALYLSCGTVVTVVPPFFCLGYAPPNSSSKTITSAFAATTGTFRYWTACRNPIICTCRGRDDGSTPMLATSSKPYRAKNLRRFRIITELVIKRPAWRKTFRECQ
jgi:hypothetical protein